LAVFAQVIRINRPRCSPHCQRSSPGLVTDLRLARAAALVAYL